MYTSVPLSSKQSYRDQHKPSYVPFRIQPTDDRRVSSVNENLSPIKLRRRRRPQSTHSFYDNAENDEDEHILSKWTIVRQRLPDILALSDTYKPATVRAQLVLLVALMNKQSAELTNSSVQSNINDYPANSLTSHTAPTNVTINISGRSRLICLKRIPSEQVIHVDVDGLSFSIPTRQFILAISRGDTHETAVKYCPPAVSDMLIDLSKTKIVDDRRQYKRAQFKMRLGQFIFLIVFILLITMVFALIIGATKTIFKFDSINDTYSHIPFESLTSRTKFPSIHIKHINKVDIGD